MNDLIKISEMSARYDISARTLRYYEEMGLLLSTRSDDYAYRMYDSEALKRLEQILILRKLNISIRDIKRIFDTAGSEVVLEVLGKKAENIDDEIALLSELKSVVLDFIEQIKAADFGSSSDIKRLYEKASEIETRLVKADYEGNTANVNKVAAAAGKLIKHQYVWVLYLPPCKMLSSGFLRGDEQMRKFDKCWTQIDSKRHDRFYARDFMYWEPDGNANIWWLALEDWMPHTLDMGGYEVVDFEGGLYAAAVCNNNEEPDFVRAYNGISEWITGNENIEMDVRAGHRVMNNVILTDPQAGIFKDKQSVLYVPIKQKD